MNKGVERGGNGAEEKEGGFKGGEWGLVVAEKEGKGRERRKGKGGLAGGVKGKRGRGKGVFLEWID